MIDIELEEMIKQAQAQPGVADVMTFCAQYNNVFQQYIECKLDEIISYEVISVIKTYI